MSDHIAADLLAEQLRELAAGDRLKICNRREHQILGARQRLRARSAHGQVDRVSELFAGAQMPAAGHGDEVIGATAQLGADVLDDQIEIALRASVARTSRETGSFEANITASTRPLAPAQLGRERVEVRIEVLGSWSSAHI